MFRYYVLRIYLLLNIPGFNLLSQGTQFQRSWGSTHATSSEECYSVIQTTDGGYAMMGYTGQGANGSGDLMILKVNSNADTYGWATHYGSAVNDITSSSGIISAFMEQATDGGFIMAGMYGRNFFTQPGQEMLLVKTTSGGGLGWERQFGNSVDISGAGDYPTDAGFCTKPTMDGGYILAGYVEGGAAGSGIYGHDVCLTKFNGTGTLQWTTRFGTSGTGNEDHGVYVDQSTDGGFIVVGSTSSGASGTYDIFLVKRTSSGAASWASRIYTANWDEGYFVNETPDGGIIILGNSGASGVASLIKVPSTGTSVTWSRNYTVTGATSTVGYNAVVCTDGGFAITGYTTIGGNQDALLIKTASDGAVQWSYRYGGSRAEEGNSIKQTSDGGYVIGGTVNTPANGNQFYLIKTLSNGSSGTCEATVTTTTASAGFNRAVPTINTTASTEGVSSTTSSRQTRASSYYKVMDCNYVVLPVELISFSGTRLQENKILLEWTTASEANNDYFTIERSIGEPDSWREKGMVFGTGNSGSPIHYTFTDHTETDEVLDRTIYYRLRQTDFNGMHEYFPPIALAPPNSEHLNLNVYYHAGQLFVILPEKNLEESFTITIFDISSRVAYTDKIQRKGKSSFSIDLTDFSSGIYFVSAYSSGGSSVAYKFILE